MYWPQVSLKYQTTPGNTHSKGGNMAGEMPRKPEGTTANSANKSIKCKRTVNMEVNENETEPHENNNHAKVKQLRYSGRK